MGWTYVNTGALYRALGILLIEADVNWEQEDLLAAATRKIAKGLFWDSQSSKLFFEKRDLSSELDGEIASMAASRVARSQAVRKELVEIQRNLGLASKELAIIDGRDIGTVIFPDADLKIYLTASLEARAKRRSAQLGVSEENCYLEIKKSIAARDAQDSGREVAPMKVADDAITVDTSHMTKDEVVSCLIEKCLLLGS